MAQLLYELCFCLWAMSLCDEAKQDFISCGAIPILAQQVPIGTKVKPKTYAKRNKSETENTCQTEQK